MIFKAAALTVFLFLSFSASAAPSFDFRTVHSPPGDSKTDGSASASSLVAVESAVSCATQAVAVAIAVSSEAVSSSIVDSSASISVSAASATNTSLGKKSSGSGGSASSAVSAVASSSAASSVASSATASVVSSASASASGSSENGSSKNGSKGSKGSKGSSSSSVVSSAAASATASSSSGNNSTEAVSSSASVSSTASAAAASSTASASNNSSDPQSALTLLPSVIATGFEDNGQDVPAAGQVASLTSSNNFINFCATVPQLPITNGQQITTGSCNPAPMGIIAATTNMPSAKFVFPANGATIPANQNFTIQMAVSNFDTGFFVNAEKNYFAGPQVVNSAGNIQGHSHVVIEKLTSLNQTTPTQPTIFAFFKGMNEAAQNGVLTATVTNGLPAGDYRLASINSAANHQPVLVAIAQHGTLDDMIYFTAQ
ncbi:hypothetical protein SCP_1003340 [Sparassis crispa]|uniref:Uncharacterized protein n=1 Tax=Sparassis crispa TaxID=139825 RepID=A0A401GY02_9APHY|nr:hypothetical protein SCP_1003340 [Sparassis crispa]GBE87087.1 hypothetical protein SCP_1003340 [Sparassis crispa]